MEISEHLDGSGLMEISFLVHGNSSDDIWNQAHSTCRLFFGNDDYVIESAMVTPSVVDVQGNRLSWRGEITAKGGETK